MRSAWRPWMNCSLMLVLHADAQPGLQWAVEILNAMLDSPISRARLNVRIFSCLGSPTALGLRTEQPTQLLSPDFPISLASARRPTPETPDRKRSQMEQTPPTSVHRPLTVALVGRWMVSRLKVHHVDGADESFMGTRTVSAARSAKLWPTNARRPRCLRAPRTSGSKVISAFRAVQEWFLLVEQTPRATTPVATTRAPRRRRRPFAQMEMRRHVRTPPRRCAATDTGRKSEAARMASRLLVKTGRSAFIAAMGPRSVELAEEVIRTI